MEYVSFGAQETQVSEIMLGLMRIADKSVAEVTELIETALDEGINALDLADIYGAGACEELVGRVLAASPGLRDRVFLQTKVGIRKEDGFGWFDFSKDYLLRAADACLRRLGVDCVDSLLLHRPDALMEPEEVAEAFQILHDQGKVRAFGVSNQNPATMRRLSRALPFPLAANQVQLSCAFAPAFEATLNANMENEAAHMRDGGIFEYCEEHDMVIQAWSSLQHGYFEGVFLGDPAYAELNAVLERIAEDRGCTPAAVALAWIVRYPAKMQAVVGTTRPERVREMARATDVRLTRREWYEIYCAAGRKLP